METSPDTTHKESTSTKEVSTDTYICRLRSGLNVNCLIQVFEYLNFSDLFVLLKMDPVFKEIILKWTIKKKMIMLPIIRYNKDFLFTQKDQSKLIHIFETFGNSMRKIRVSISSLQFILELIMEYCEPAQLINVDLHIAGKDDFMPSKNLHRLQAVPTDSILMDLSMPFFSNLHTLTLRVNGLNEINQKMMNLFLTKILIRATNLRTLKVDNLHNNGWLKYVKNLYELRYFAAGSYLNGLDSSLTMNPNLKVFTVTNTWDDLKSVGLALSKSCPALEYFSDILYSSPYNRFHSIIDRYDFLSTMNNLNRVGLTSFTSCCCDLYYPLKSLANKNITHLEIRVAHTFVTLDENMVADLMQRTLPDFNKLHSIEIVSYSQKETNCRFIFRLAKHLKNLKICTTMHVPSVHKILENAPSIHTLEQMWDVDEQTAADIVKTLREIRRSDDKQHLLNLRLPSCCWRSKKYFPNDTKDVIKISRIPNF